MNPSNNFLQNEINQIYEQLQHLKSMNIDPEFDIKIDDMLVVPRTSNLEDFDRYKPMLKENSLCVQVRVYRGKSRTYDLHKFKTPYAVQSNSEKEQNLSHDNLKMDLINSVSKERFTDYLYNEAKKKVKKLKRRVDSLEEENRQLKEKNPENSLLGTVSSLVPMLTDKLGKQGTGLNGIDDKYIQDALNMIQKNLTADELERVMGINLFLAQNKAYIKTICDYIADQKTR